MKTLNLFKGDHKYTVCILLGEKHLHIYITEKGWSFQLKFDISNKIILSKIGK